jgi:hypothetical protein
LDRQRFVVDRRFWAGDGRQRDFEAVFGAVGIWQELAVQAGMIRTEFWCESAVERRYRVRDFWTTHLEFEAFREGFALEYRKFEQLLVAEGVVERQEIVGAYYVNEGSDGDLAVPAES